MRVLIYCLSIFLFLSSNAYAAVQVKTVQGGFAIVCQPSDPNTNCGGGGGGGTPGGSNTQVQFNNSGSFGGNAGFVYTAGNVAIGTSSPDNRLTIKNSDSAGWADIGLRSDSTNGLDLKANGSANDNTNFYNENNANVIRSHGSAGLRIISDDPDGTIRFTTGGPAFSDEKMQIAADGNVGIGEPNPASAKLQVNGDVLATSFIGDLTGTASGNLVNIAGQDLSTADNSVSQFITAADVTNTSGWLDGGTSVALVTSTDTVNIATLASLSGGNLSITGDNALSLSSSADNLTIGSANDLTMTAANGFSLTGDSSFNLGSNNGDSTIYATSGALTITADNGVKFNSGLTTTGNVGIGTLNPPNELYVVGGIASTSVGSMPAGSVLCSKIDGTTGHCTTMVGLICTVCQ